MKTKRKALHDNKSVKNSSRIAQFTTFNEPHGFLHSFGQFRGLVKVKVHFDTMHPIKLDARHTFVKLFLRHSYLKNHNQVVDYLRSKVQERDAIHILHSPLR